MQFVPKEQLRVRQPIYFMKIWNWFSKMWNWISSVWNWISPVWNWISPVWNWISFVWNWISFVWNWISFVWNWISFVRNRPENGIVYIENAVDFCLLIYIEMPWLSSWVAGSPQFVYKRDHQPPLPPITADWFIQLPTDLLPSQWRNNLKSERLSDINFIRKGRNLFYDQNIFVRMRQFLSTSDTWNTSYLICAEIWRTKKI